MSRIGGFAAPGESLDDAGRRGAGRCAIEARFRGKGFVSPAQAARETADAIGLAAREEPALADIDYGAWAGRSFADLHDEASAELADWLGDPVAGVPQGESMEAVRTRIGRWLDTIAGADGPVCAVTHATVIRAALSHALNLSLRATLAIDIAPLSRTILSFNRTWRLQAIAPFD